MLGDTRSLILKTDFGPWFYSHGLQESGKPPPPPKKKKKKKKQGEISDWIVIDFEAVNEQIKLFF